MSLRYSTYTLEKIQKIRPAQDNAAQSCRIVPPITPTIPPLRRQLVQEDYLPNIYPLPQGYSAGFIQLDRFIAKLSTGQIGYILLQRVIYKTNRSPISTNDNVPPDSPKDLWILKSVEGNFVAIRPIRNRRVYSRIKRHFRTTRIVEEFKDNLFNAANIRRSLGVMLKQYGISPDSIMLPPNDSLVEFPPIVNPADNAPFCWVKGITNTTINPNIGWQNEDVFHVTVY